MDWSTLTRLEKEGRLPAGEVAPSSAGPYVVEVVLSTGDQHGRFVDEKAWAAVLRVLDRLHIDRFVFNGDMLDFYELSRFVKDPDVEESVQVDIDYGKRFLGDVRKRLSEGQPIDVVPGNHERRYELYLRGDAKKLSGLKVLELPNLLEIERFGATMHQYSGFELQGTIEPFRIYHGEVVRKHASESARHELTNWGCSGASQHVHRLGIHRVSTTTGDRLWGEGGCLCGLDPEYVTRKPNWQHGCLLIFRMSDGTVRMEEVRILNGQVQGTLGHLIGDKQLRLSA